MASPGPDPDVTLDETRRVFVQSAHPSTPLTAPEVAEKVGCTRRTAHRKLERLAERGELLSKKTGARSRVWWRPGNDPVDGELATTDETRLEEFGAFVRAVEDYAIFMLDPDGVVVSWNEGAERIKGYTEDEILGRHYSTFYTDEQREAGVPEANLEQAATDGRLEDEGWRVRQDGTRFWANAVITAIRADDGSIRGFTKVTRDLTERREYEQQLLRERNQTEKLLRTAPTSIAVQDADGETLMANHRAQETLGLSESEIVETPHDADEWTIYDGDGEEIDPDETPPTRVRETGEPVRDVEIAVEKPDGNLSWFIVNAAPVFDGEGDLDRVVVAGDDVTELKRRERELELRKSELETELSEIFGRISDAFYALDEEWRFTHVNEHAAELLGYAETDLLGATFWEVFPDARETELGNRLTAAAETQEPVSFEWRSDGFDGWIEISAYPSDTGLSVYFQDVTDRIRRERELERYRQIVETINDGVYTVDAEGRFTTVNDAYAEMTGYPREELLGSHVSRVVGEETIERSGSIEEELRRGEEETVRLEAEMRTAEGEHVPGEATFALLSVEDGFERVGVVRDISERIERERALERSERRYRTLAEHFPNGAVAIYDHDLRYTLAEGAVLGESMPPASVIEGIRMPELFPPEITAELEPMFRSAIEDGETGSTTVELSSRTWRVWAAPLREADGEIFAGLSFTQDVTEQVERQRKLEASNERLERFAYVASHDLQEPLRMISNYLQLLSSRYGDDLDEDATEFIDYAVDGAERMQAMIDDLLTYSRVESQAEPFEPVDVNAAVDRVLEDLRLQIEETDAEVVVGELPTVEADGKQLDQVFQNLVSNAIKYRGEDPPRIEIDAEDAGSAWRFRVEDDGIGIDPEYADRIFEVFERLHTHDEYPGTGIGLALCEKIVERHGGGIRVESRPGEGATFYLTIPKGGNDDD